MERQEIQKHENRALQRKEASTALIATLINPEQARSFERGLTIAKIVGSAMPLSEIVRETGFKSVAQAIDIHLTRCVAQFNRNNNLNDQQIKTIVEDLIDKYPNESVEDFILCFKMARQEEFEVPMWLDSSVVFGWVRQYLDRKYEQLERKLQKDAAARNEKAIPKDLQGLSPVAEKALADMQKIVDETAKRSKIPAMTDAEIRRNGQLYPPRKSSITKGLQTFILGGYSIQAMDRKQAKKQMRIFIRNGKVPFHISRGNAKSRRK